MLRFASDYRARTGLPVRGLSLLVAAAGLLAGGCSSNATRFDYPFFGLTESSASGPPPRTRAEGPAPIEPLGGSRYTPQGGTYGQSYGAPPAAGYGPPNTGNYSGSYGAPQAGTYGQSYGAPPVGSYGPSQTGNTYGGPQTGSQSSNIAVSALPKTDGQPRPAPVFVAPPARNVETAPAAAPVAPAARSTAAAPVARDIPSGEEIEVKEGDTLYTLGRRHHVSMSELMRVNGMSDPNLKPGQKLRLPAGARAVAKAAPAAQSVRPAAESRPAPATPAVAAATSTAPAAPVAAAAAPAGWTDSYTTKSGDSLYGIARKRGVTVAELQRVNGITDVRKMMPGVTLKLPPENAAGGGGQGAVAPTPAASVVADPQPAGGPRPTVLNAPRAGGVETKSAALATAPTSANASRDNVAKEVPAQAKKEEAAQPKAAAEAKLRWPVKGRIISGFGPQSDGTQNDGVNVAVPLGTEVLAAETGVVAYAGSEVRGYGNLVLVRHDNGWVTAYAHNDQLLVQRGDRVRRGQVLGKAGKTGSVDQPQLHFEVRQGPKPVDPLPHMERM
jgi:murein DD-endopeptidase MepM/ murein hydrolase activator NlpD